MQNNKEMNELIKILLNTVDPLNRREIIKAMYAINEKIIREEYKPYKESFYPTNIDTYSNKLRNTDFKTISHNDNVIPIRKNKLDDIIENIKNEELDEKLHKINKLYYKILSKK